MAALLELRWRHFAPGALRLQISSPETTVRGNLVWKGSHLCPGAFQPHVGAVGCWGVLVWSWLLSGSSRAIVGVTPLVAVVSGGDGEDGVEC